MRKKSVGTELRSISNLSMRYMDRYSHKQYVDSITGTNARVIVYLSEHDGEDVFQKDLEKSFSITRSTASKVINLMASKGFIEFSKVPYDARLKKLILTDKARDLVSLMKQDRDMLDEKMTEGISHRELEVFFECVEKMKNNLEEK